jgi:hypothetical protein
MIQFALLAMQAAGMVTDWYATQQEKAIGRMGEGLNQAAINANMATLRAQSEEQSAMAMQKLRQTIGSQIAIQAARGVQSGAGSSLALMKDSEREFGQDERARRMNLLVSENELRAKGVLSGLHQLKSETELGRKVSKDFFNKMPTDPKAYSQIGSNLKSDFNNFKSAFGMTSI